ncbi:MAG: DUF3459 domain-containing protein, partial [Sphingomonadales bacterium]|nr:DUF3459 domain-containing protein [Sphingomonadales bacterium]
VDGFRLDALNFAMHDPALRDNPPAPDDGTARTRPFDFQLRKYNQSNPAIPAFIERIRALTDDYDAVFTMAEVGGADALREMHLYTKGSHRLNSAYGFDFLYAEALTPALVAQAQADWPDRAGAGWPSWAFENHDAPRALSRWCAPQDRAIFARVKVLLLASLRGNPIIYQGEELGLTQVDIPFEQLQDPEAIANWPLTLSRDGARTPMPWLQEAAEGGFTTGKPWLPLGAENLDRAVDRQVADPASLLNLTRDLLVLRRTNPALRLGGFEVLLADDALLVVRRATATHSVLCLFNLSNGERPWPEMVEAKGTVLASVNAAMLNETVPAYGALLIEEMV